MAAYSNSPLVSYTKISPNKTSPRNHVIDTITIHCTAGQCSVESLGAIFLPSSRQASSNYGVGYDGKIGMYCEEKDRSWCSSSSANDHRAITIEVASDSYHPYAVSAKAYAALIDLLVDICSRNNIKELKWLDDKDLIGQPQKQNLTIHRWFANKACPGDYLYKLHPQIAKEVNSRLGVTVIDPTIPALSFSEGDKVKIIGSTYYGGKAVPLWVKNKTWIVHSASADRVIVDKSTDGLNSIMSPFRAEDLQLISSKPAIEGTASSGSGDDAKKIWNFLIEKIPNPYGVAGLMGNLYAESGLRSNNLQQTYESKLGFTDDSYTKAVDNGTYTNFVKDSAGYGLAQWTYWSRKQALQKFASNAGKSIGDLEMQLDFLWHELQGYSGVLDVLMTATSVRQASDSVLLDFERPANTGETVQTNRVSYGQNYYNTFAATPSKPDEGSKPVEQQVPFMVRVSIDDLNIRRGPGTNYAKGGFTGKGSFTIVELADGKGASKWGLLKSYKKNRNGWISLDYAKKL